jgi:hypothetical protein
MPQYRITTRHEVEVGTFIGGSTTVDSLDEATDYIAANILPPRLPLDAPVWDTIDALTERGGTIGPLPDGTVIEVRPA